MDHQHRRHFVSLWLQSVDPEWCEASFPDKVFLINNKGDLKNKPSSSLRFSLPTAASSAPRRRSPRARGETVPTATEPAEDAGLRRDRGAPFLPTCSYYLEGDENEQLLRWTVASGLRRGSLLEYLGRKFLFELATANVRQGLSDNLTTDRDNSGKYCIFGCRPCRLWRPVRPCRHGLGVVCAMVPG